MRVAYMLTAVEATGILVRRARIDRGLSVRELASRAGVAASTVSRIEAGQVDPGVATLFEIFRAAGICVRWEVRREASCHLSDLSDAWRRSGAGDRPDWTRLRAFIDYLTRHPDEVADAVDGPPEVSGSLLMDALLAGIAEKLADDVGIGRPAWTARAGRLSEPTFLVPVTPRMRERIRQETPRQLAERGVMVDLATLWRGVSVVGDR